MLRVEDKSLSIAYIYWTFKNTNFFGITNESLLCCFSGITYFRGLSEADLKFTSVISVSAFETYSCLSFTLL